ncbi:MAG: hypothetical protein NXH82_16745 [Rhodobacteraceae bacterium]|nr:hypothetical protein [Paracoccaceae bacterium]
MIPQRSRVRHGRLAIALTALALLTACGDPLADVEKLSDVELQPEAGAVDFVPQDDPADAAPEADAAAEGATPPGRGLLARLLDPAPGTPGDPADADKPDAEPVAPGDDGADAGAGAVAVAPEENARADPSPRPARGGLFGFLGGGAPRAAPAAAPLPDVAETIAEPPRPEADADVGPPVRAATETSEARAGIGLFGFLRARADGAPETAVDAGAPEAKPEAEPAPDADAAAAAAPSADGPAPAPRQGLFAWLGSGDAGAAAAPVGGRDAALSPPSPVVRDTTPDLPLSAPLAYGQIVRACAAKRRDLGRRVARFPEKGGQYHLYDSDPGNISAHDFFVTGFADGCPRRFVAALALFGAPSMHEQLRYGRPGDLYPYSATDKAYEKLKSRICGVGRRKPCGARIAQMERNTVFISTYENFEENARWADILLHDGAVVASGLKEG